MWYECLENSAFIKRIIKSIPELTNVELWDVDLNIGNDQITTIVGMSTFVDFPPKKWGDSGVYDLLLTLEFYNITELIYQFNQLSSCCSIKIERANEKFKVNFIGNFNLEFSCDVGVIQTIKVMSK